MDTTKTIVEEFNQNTSSCETEGNSLREGIKILWKNFLLDTSLHGCSSIPKSQYHWLRRLLWFLFLAASTSSLIVYVVEFYNEYNKNPFITKNRLERVKSLPLPAISICNEKFQKSKVNDSDEFEEYYIAKKNPFVQAFGNFNMTEPSTDELDQLNGLPLEEFGMQKEDVILKAFINDRNIDVKSEFQYLASFFGQCFTYNMVGDDGEGGDITLSQGQTVHMILNISQEDFFPSQYGGTELILHDPRDLPTPASIYVSAAPGYMTKIYLKATQLTFLPKPYKSYGEEYCVESTDSASKGMKGRNEYTWYTCVEECAVKYAEKLCNCTAKFGRYVEPLSYRVCSSEEFKQCISPTIKQVFYSVAQQNHTICDCPQPCETIQYDVRTTLMTFPSKPVADFLIKRGAVSSYQDLSDNYASVDILFDQMILHHVEHIPEIDAGDIFAKLGGQMGLFLGASILTLLEVGETMLLTVFLLGKAAIRSVRGPKVGATK